MANGGEAGESDKIESLYACAPVVQPMSPSRLARLILCAALLAPALADEAGQIAAELQRGNAGEALSAADRALSRKPSDARLRLLRGNALAALGRQAEAIQVFQALTRDYPALPEPYNNLAALYAQQGQLDRARTTLQMALQTNPAYATAHANLADVYAKLASQAYEKALQRDVVEQTQNPAPRSSNGSSGNTRLALVQDLLSRPGNPVPPAVASAPASAAKPPVLAANTAGKPPVSLPQTAAGKPTPDKAAQDKATAEKAAANKPAGSSKPVSPTDASANEEQAVRNSVEAWADAWSDKRVSAYLASYARSFKPGGQSRADWEQQRRERISAAKKIVVKVERLRIKLDDTRATARFIQRYKSDRLDTSTGKTLILEKNNGRWLITEERVG